MKDIERMQHLIRLLSDASYKYYSLGDTDISDKQYDALYDELLSLEKSTGSILPHSPTQRVGDELLDGFSKFVHEVPLYSLEKCTGIDALSQWCNELQKRYRDTSFSVEYKYDGLSLVIEYDQGVLVRAGTRGNGRVGEDVTAQVKTIKSIPLSIDHLDKVLVYGEVIMTWSAFNKYNLSHEDKLKNPRNAAAGALKNLDPKVTASRGLSAYFYGVELCEHISDQAGVKEFLVKNRFPTQGNGIITNNVDEIIKYITDIDAFKSKLDYLIDGIVIKVNEGRTRQDLGYTAKHPKWAMAYKYEAEETTTIIKAVIWQVGRTGKITPIAQLSPVELAGATISRATLNNINDIRRKEVSIGSSVFIRRSNEVIPEIMGIAKKSPEAIEILAPKLCPSCDSPLVEKGAHLFCLNHEHCPDQVVDRLSHFCTRDAMNIDSMSGKTIMVMNSVLGVAFPYQIYHITKEQMMSLPLVKEKKAVNLLNSIENSKKVDFSSFVYALGIPNIGKKSAHQLTKKYSSIEDLISAKMEEFVAIHDFGETMANSVIEYFAEVQNVINIRKLIDAGVSISYARGQNISEYFKNKKIVLTGTLSSYTRSQLTAVLLSKGADVVSSVSKKTDFVIAGVEAGGKLATAINLNIHIIYENDLHSWLKN